jgi:ribosomal protein S4
MFENIKKDKVKTPKWIISDIKSLKGEITALPDKDDVEQIIEHQLITEYYSK